MMKSNTAKYVVNAERLNVRSAAGYDQSVVGTLDRNVLVNVSSTKKIKGTLWGQIFPESIKTMTENKQINLNLLKNTPIEKSLIDENSVDDSSHKTSPVDNNSVDDSTLESNPVETGTFLWLCLDFCVKIV